MSAMMSETAQSRYHLQTVEELQRAVLRRIVLGVLFLAWISSAPFALPTLRPALVFSIATFGLAGLCFWLLGASYRLSACLLLLGLWALGIALTWLYPEQPVAFFLCLIVAAAVFLLGFWPGALLAAASSGSLLLMAYWLVPALPRSAALGGALLSWCTLLVVGEGTRPVATLVGWSWRSFEEARQKAAELQERQGKLSHVIKDLDNAYEELARANEKLALSNAVAQEARRAKAEFVANVSHELRTPINMIIGFTEMIVRNPRTYARNGLPAGLLADLDVILRNAQHLSGLINDVLDLSQIDAARMGLAKEWSSLTEIAQAAVGAIAPLAHTRGLSIQLQAQDLLPPVLVDRTRIRQVLLNLLSNAARFTEAGQITVCIRQQGDALVTSVSDTGPGIAADDIPKLFEPFRQLDGSLRRRYGGTGLGLHISRRFVVLHGGEMAVESELGKGTTIRFSLPIQDTVPFSPLERAGASNTEAYQAAPSFVVVEPHPVVEDLLQRQLDDCTVTAAQSIGEAVEVSRSQPTTGIVLRATHKEEAWRLLAQAEELDCDAPLVACSIPGALEAYVEELGLAGYLLKPVTQEQILQALAEVPQARTVLIVDDNRDFLRLFAAMLRSAHQRYVVWQAAGGEEALALLQNRRPDVIFLDVLLPDVDGPALLKRIRAQERLADVPVFFVTAQDAAGSPLVANFLGIAHPDGLSAHELVRCIQALGQALSGAIPPLDRERPATRPG